MDRTRQLPLDIEEEVFRHLLFHKSLIDDEGEVYERIDRYLQVLSELQEGVHVTIHDSYSRSIAMILELATEEYLDPWDVDLIKFCKLFINRIRSQDRLNLMVVGKLIRMAYTVHYLKSANTLKKAEITQEAVEFDDDGFSPWMEEDESFEVTRNIMQGEKAPISESVLHKGDRPVTLVDLLNALNEVNDEVEEFKRMRERRIENSKKLERHSRSLIDKKVYKENVEEEIRLTWQRVNKFNGHPIPLSQLNQGSDLDSTSTFISLLFLAMWSRVKVWQRRFPHGEIFVKNISKDGGDLEFGDLDENLDKARAGQAKLRPPEELIVEGKPVPDHMNT